MRATFIYLFLMVVLLMSCNSWRYGYTQSLAFNSYNLVSENEKNFGNKRVRYNMGHHARSPLAYFLKVKGKPDFIFEYEDDQKRDGINLYYLNADSAFLFIEKKKNTPSSSSFVEARKLNEYEKLTYKNLVEQKQLRAM